MSRHTDHRLQVRAERLTLDGRARNNQCAHPHKVLQADGNTFRCADPACNKVVGFAHAPTRKPA